MVRSSAPAAPELSTPEGLTRSTFDAMGTRVTVIAPEEREYDAVRVVRRLFVEWDVSLSRFRGDSELSYLNDHAGEPVVVSTLLWRVLTTALGAAHATDGIYDPTMLRQLAAAGYDRTFVEVERLQRSSSQDPEPGGGWRDIRLNLDYRTVTLPDGVALDVGGIAKGMAVDAALEALAEMGLPAAVVEAGGDLRVHGNPPSSRGWPVAVALPEGSETVTVFAGGLATSTSALRRWRQGDAVRHHILDPRTGGSAETGIWSVTVNAGRCAQADVAAKTAFILGPDEGSAFLTGHGFPALMITQNGKRQRVGEWPDPDRDGVQ